MKRSLLAVLVVAILAFAVPSFADVYYDFSGNGFGAGSVVTKTGSTITGDINTLSITSTIGNTTQTMSGGMFDFTLNTSNDQGTLDIVSNSVTLLQGSFTFDVLGLSPNGQSGAVGLIAGTANVIEDQACSIGCTIGDGFQTGFMNWNANHLSFSSDIPAVPEPVSLAMLAPGLLFGAGFLRRRKING